MTHSVSVYMSTLQCSYTNTAYTRTFVYEFRATFFEDNAGQFLIKFILTQTKDSLVCGKDNIRCAGKFRKRIIYFKGVTVRGPRPRSVATVRKWKAQ